MRYDRLKEEFGRLTKKLLSGGSSGALAVNAGSKSKMGKKEDVSVERAEFEVKLDLYKNQIKKMQ